MSQKSPTPVSFARGIYLCLLVIFHPSGFAKLEREDNAILEASPHAPQINSVLRVRDALLNSLLLVLAAAGAGFLLGYVLRTWWGPATAGIVAMLQVIGALTLLWATLAVRGWDILTFGGITYTERVNQWIYRFIYCVGTSILVWSLAW